MDSRRVIGALSAIAQPTRLEVLRLLGPSGAGLTAGELAAAAGAATNTMSAHLTILSRASLVTAHREGRSIVYRADPHAVRELADHLLRDLVPAADGAGEATRAPPRGTSDPQVRRGRPRRKASGKGDGTGDRIAATLSAASAQGLMEGTKDKRLSLRTHEVLVATAAERSGLEGGELLEYALARVAVEDR